MQQVLQLRDVWGNVCTPAAAKLAGHLATSGQVGGADLEPSQEQPLQQQPQQLEEGYVSTLWSPEQWQTLMQLRHGQLPGQPPSHPPGQSPGQQPAKRQRTARSRQQAAATPDGTAAGGGTGAQHEWQLQLYLEEPATAAGAATSSRAAAAAAAAAGEERRAVRLIHTLPFDADGCCTVPELSLKQRLGITTVGEYRLVGQAAPASGAAGASSSRGSGAQLALLLGSWHVVSESTRELQQRQVAARHAQRDLAQRVRRAEAEAGQQEAALHGVQAKLRQATAAVKAARHHMSAREGTLRRPPPEQLQQAAAAAAQQQRLLAGLGAGNRVRQPLLEHPWTRQGPGGQPQRQQLAARFCTPGEVCHARQACR